MVASRSQEDDDRSGVAPVIDQEVPDKDGSSAEHTSITSGNSLLKVKCSGADKCLILSNKQTNTQHLNLLRDEREGEFNRKRSRSTRSGEWLSSSRRTPQGTQSPWRTRTTPSASARPTTQGSIVEAELKVVLDECNKGWQDVANHCVQDTDRDSSEDRQLEGALEEQEDKVLEILDGLEEVPRILKAGKAGAVQPFYDMRMSNLDCWARRC
jgi:hypothetical protein